MTHRYPGIAATATRPAADALTVAQRKARTAGAWRSFAAAWAIAAMLLSLGPPAQAAPVTYAFSGVFDVFNSSLNVYTDKPFEGSFTYDPSIAPLGQAQAGAATYDALIAFELNVLDVPSAFALRVGLTRGAPTARIGIDEASNGAPSDAFRISVSSEPRGFIDSPLAWDAFLLVFELERILGSVFDDALSLPPTLDLGDFDRTHVELRLVDASAFFQVDGRLTSLNLVDTPAQGVPEPGILELLSIAAAAFAVAVWREPRPGRQGWRRRPTTGGPR